MISGPTNVRWISNKNYNIVNVSVLRSLDLLSKILKNKGAIEKWLNEHILLQPFFLTF